MEGESLQAALRFLESWLDYRSRQVDIPGFCIAIYYKDSIVFSRAYGFANVSHGERLTTAHLFGMASQSKMFTSTAILQLVEAGKLRLDDFAYDYVSWLAEHRDKRFSEITIRQLLSHSSGLISDGLDADFWELKRPFPTSAGLRASVLGADIAAEPNRSMKYSNLAFALLGQIIKAASGQSYQRYIREHIGEPLGLINTYPDYARKLAEQTATGYGEPREHERLALEPRQATKAMAPAVGIHATVEDMCRFVAGHFYGNKLLLSDRLKKEAQRTQAIMTSGRDVGTEFGLGFRMQMLGRRRLIGHDGHLVGHLSATFFDPDERLVVSVAANAQDAPSVQVANGIFEALDWFAVNLSRPVPKKLARFSVRLLSDMSSVELVAGDHHVAAIDLGTWSPFSKAEMLERVDTRTLRVTTPGSMSQIGELITYTFDKGLVRAVRYAGLTMIPESGYVGRKLEELESDLENSRLTLEDVQHATLHVGRVRKVGRCRGRLRYRLLVDFGPQFTTRYCYLPSLPAAATTQSLVGKQVLGAAFAIWDFGKVRHEVLAIGLALSQQANATLSSNNLVQLTPDPAYSRILSRRTSLRHFDQIENYAHHSLFKIQALPDYPAEEIGFGGESLTMWRQGRYNRARALMQQARPPSWQKVPNKMRLVLIDGQLSDYQKWSIEFKKRVTIPSYGEMIYLMQRKHLQHLDLPEGDFTIWDNKRVTVIGYTDNRWTHTSIYDMDRGNNIRAFLKLQQKLITVIHRHGQRLT